MSRWWQFLVPVSTWGVFLTLIVLAHWVGGRRADAPTVAPTSDPVSVAPQIGALPYGNAVRAASIAYGVPEILIASVIACESNWNPKARSRKDARGLMQVMPATSRGTFGVHPRRLWEPWMNVHVGTAYLRVLSAQFKGNARATLAAYNAGPSRTSLNAGLPHETRRYLGCIERRYERYSRQLNERDN